MKKYTKEEVIKRIGVAFVAGITAHYLSTENAPESYSSEYEDKLMDMAWNRFLTNDVLLKTIHRINSTCSEYLKHKHVVDEYLSTRYPILREDEK